jgi:aspartyl-tRNA(Asn)/glutamyl-tRNA(Gln) amidotransferase subunit A
MAALTTISELAPRLRRREISPVEITQACLEHIEKLNPVLNAFITVTAESALAAARTAEAEIARGEWRGPLHGIPIALKDLIDTAGVHTTAASERYKDRVPAVDSEVVRRLKQAGAVIVGKNNLHEFAYGGSSLVSYFGDVHNPWDTARIAGGSSGGSAAAVAAGLCFAAIGTDTAGSIREPASLCGCVGLKPAYGRVSSRGVIPLSFSLDHVGPLTTSVADAAIVLQAIAGYDAGDITTPDVPVADYMSPLREGAKSLRVGVPRNFFYDDLDADVAAAVEQALEVIKTLVADVREVELDVPADRTLQMAESYAYHEQTATESPELYQPETLRRVLTGAKISAADYIQSRRELEQARRSIGDVFAGVDLLVTPTTPIPAPAIADLKATPESLRPAELKLLRNTRPFNVWGLPAISIPCGFTKADGTKPSLPIGLQIAGPHWREDFVLRLAHAYEQATEWHERKPRGSLVCKARSDEEPAICVPNIQSLRPLRSLHGKAIFRHHLRRVPRFALVRWKKEARTRSRDARCNGAWTSSL